MSEAVAGGAVLSEAGPCGFLNLRGDPASARFLDAVTASFGVDLPRTPNTYQRVADCTAYWLAPDEWLLAMPDGEQAAMENRLRETLADRHFSVVDVSGSYVRLVLAGTGARTVLQQGQLLRLPPQGICARPLRPNRFRQGYGANCCGSGRFVRPIGSRKLRRLHPPVGGHGARCIAGPYRPFQIGSRFSANALAPSRWSSLS